MGVRFFLADERTRRQLMFIASSLMFCFFAFYLYYNSSFFKQVFAYHFYKPVSAEMVRRNTFGCISVNIIRIGSFLDKNEHILRGGSVGNSNFQYAINNKTYQSSGYSYVKKTVGCNFEIEKAYYFPLFPKWSVLSNHLPEKEYWNNFINSTVSLFVKLSMFILALFFLKNREGKH